jgi:hypothetical protein
MLEMIRPAGLATAGRGKTKRGHAFGTRLSNSQNTNTVQVSAIRAELNGSDACTAAGVTARAVSPVLAICKKLGEAGFDPNRPLHAYRGGTLCLVIRSIDEGARLAVKAAGHGPPIFTVEERATASPIARLSKNDPTKGGDHDHL